jgi:ABC-type polysaccharide/polyol phosphate export permease
VFYEVQSVPSKFSDFFLYNPLSSLITNLRTIILGHSFYGMNFLLCNTVICAVFLICGIFLYNLNKKKFPYINTI